MFNRLFTAKGESPEQNFWKWFASNSARYFDFEQNQEALFNELNDALLKVHAGLTFEFGPREESARDFVISADGNKEVFPAVQRLVEVAPELSKWRIMAFRPRRDTDFRLEIGGIKIGPEHLWFKSEPDGRKVGLHLFMSEFEDVNSEAAVMVSFLMLDTALGEYDVETKLGFLERHVLPTGPAKHGLKPFQKLPGEFDALHAMLNQY